MITVGTSISLGDTSSDYKSRRLRIRHIESCLQIYQSKMLFEDDVQDQIGFVASQFSWVYYENHQYEKCIELNEQVVEARKSFLSGGHPSTLAAIDDLAIRYSCIPNRLQDALSLHEHVVEASQKILHRDNKSVLEWMNNLASTYMKADRYEDAMRLLEQLLETNKRVRGYENYHTLITMHNVADVYRQIRRGHDAVILAQQVLDMRKIVLGDDHPETIRTMHILALIYTDLNRNEDAISLMTQAVEMSKQVQGEEHPKTLRLAQNLAFVLSAPSHEPPEVSGGYQVSRGPSVLRPSQQDKGEPTKITSERERNLQSNQRANAETQQVSHTGDRDRRTSQQNTGKDRQIPSRFK